ncbi:MAG: hypothetical protein V1799_17115 [bacterium]
MNSSIRNIYDILYSSGQRLPSLEKWLVQEVWSKERFEYFDSQEYLESGEKKIKAVEDLILNAATGIYDEIVAASESSPSLLDELQSPKTAIVVFDGVSIRELPLLEILALKTNFSIASIRYGYAALPSDTVSYIDQRLLGKRIGPSQLRTRKEFKDRQIIARHYDTLIRHYEFPNTDSPLLLWSSFPDGTYMNFEAKSSGHFDAIMKQFDVAWKNIVLSIPRDYRIIITSDHGYVYLHAGYESELKSDKALDVINNNRFRIFEENEDLNLTYPELQILTHKRLAMLRGRIKNRPQGSSASKIFRHGGMSLMEMLTPDIELQYSN